MTMTGKWISQLGGWLSKWWWEGSWALPLWSLRAGQNWSHTCPSAEAAAPPWLLFPPCLLGSILTFVDQFFLHRSTWAMCVHTWLWTLTCVFSVCTPFWAAMWNPSTGHFQTPHCISGLRQAIMVRVPSTWVSWLLSDLLLPWGSYSSCSPHLYLYRDISRSLCLRDSLFFWECVVGAGKLFHVALVGGDPFLKVGELWPYSDCLSIASSMELG